MSSKYLYITGLLVLALTSCEEVIDLDLTNVAPQVVIEGFVTDQQGPYTIQISKTVDFYEGNSFPLQENAVVRIFDDRGNDEILSETSPGIYETTSLQGERGATYSLEVVLEGKVYTAICKMPEALIPLDSITTEFLEESIFNDEGYYASAFFNDIPDLDEYFRLQVLVNGETYFFIDEEDEVAKPEEDINFWLTNDKFTDGNLQDYEFPHTLKIGDTMHVTLANLDRSTFDYYRTLVDVIYGDGVAPSNPISNMKGGALGYFAAFSLTADSVVVE